MAKVISIYTIYIEHYSRSSVTENLGNYSLRFQRWFLHVAGFKIWAPCYSLGLSQSSRSRSRSRP